MRKYKRREFLGMSLAGLGAMAAFPAFENLASGQTDNTKRRFNVLHIISDDLCNRLGCYGDPLVRSPQIDRLAAQGIRFDRAYCQYPLCNPSRTSFMTGLRPDTTRAYVNQTHFRDTVPEAVTLPQSFRKAGYRVARVGKIYHYGVPAEIGTNGLDDPASWEEVVNPKGRDVDDISLVEVLTIGPDGNATTKKAEQLRGTGGTLSWLAAEGNDEEQTDGIGASAAIALLERFAKEEQPFYLAVGFYRPHTPFVAPKSYFEWYPREMIPLPEAPPGVDRLFPAAALESRKPEEAVMNDDLRRRAIQAYYASTSLMDAQVGRLLDTLEKLNLVNDTIVVFHSDHGYHLGEKNLWKKMSVFEESARVPLIISVPGNQANGKTCHRTVELLSLHKTLAGLCGIDADAATEGHSLQTLIENPAAAWERPAYTQVQRQRRQNAPVTGRSVRTERWRYTEWDGGREGVELYDHDNDPAEMTNLAQSPAHKETATLMQTLLRNGYKAL